MEVSGQFHAPATLLQGNKPLVPILYDAGWTSEGSGCGGEEKETLPLPRIEPQSSSRKASQYTERAIPVAFRCCVKNIIKM
jgi:hypothetical protein